MLLPPRMEKFLNEVTYKINPNFKIKNKANKTGLYAFLSFFGKIFNPAIDTRYITVVNGECWYPASNFDAEGNFKPYLENSAVNILAHETMHEYDRKRLGNFVYTLMYSSPQILALLSLLSVFAIWNSWWLLSLLFLLLAAPIPSPGRAHIELRGYRVNMMLHRLDNGDEQAYAEWVADTQFCSPAYFFMFPFRNYVISNLLETEYENEYMYGAIKDWFKLNP